MCMDYRRRAYTNRRCVRKRESPEIESSYYREKKERKQARDTPFLYDKNESVELITLFGVPATGQTPRSFVKMCISNPRPISFFFVCQMIKRSYLEPLCALIFSQKKCIKKANNNDTAWDPLWLKQSIRIFMTYDTLKPLSTLFWHLFTETTTTTPTDTGKLMLTT